MFFCRVNCNVYTVSNNSCSMRSIHHFRQLLNSTLWGKLVLHYDIIRDAHSNVFWLFFDCFSLRFSAVFTAHSKVFTVKTDKKNGYHELPPPGILENRGKNSFSSDVACWQRNQHVCTLSTHVSVLRVTCCWHFATVYILDSINGLPKYI